MIRTLPCPARASRALVRRLSRISDRWPRCISRGGVEDRSLRSLIPVGKAAGKTCRWPARFPRQLQFFHAAFVQLRVAHDLGDHLVGPGHFFLDDFNLQGGGAFGLAQGARQRIGGVVDDGQRIFDLVGEFGGQPAGGMQLGFARGEFGRLNHRLAAGVAGAVGLRSSTGSATRARTRAAAIARQPPPPPGWAEGLCGRRWLSLASVFGRDE